MEPLRISAKNLGELAKADFCPRCFWLRTHAKRLPYQIFPGIFSSIDAFTKRVVNGYFDDLHHAPAWLDGIGPITGTIHPPSHHSFRMGIPRHGILLTGEADAIFELADGTIAIVDYKTAKYTGTQDELMPVYEVQLNGYALIAEHIGLGTVSKLALMYAEPVTDPATAASDAVRLTTGFALPLRVTIHPVPLDPARLEPLFHRAREIYDLPQAPKSREDCEDCEALEYLCRISGGL